MTILYIIIAIVVAFIAIILIRTATFKPGKGKEYPPIFAQFDKEAAVSALAELVKCKTVSYSDSSIEDNAEFNKLTEMLPTLYPNVTASCEFAELPGRALLYRWKGKGEGDPAVLMAHYDVVPVEEDKWDVPAFEAVIKDGAMWGRGTLDTKVTFNGILFAADTLIKSGFIPEHDVFFAFSGGEEINGPGAVNIVEYFKTNGIKPAFVIDEGGAVIENVFPGISKPCALVGIAEKGLMNLEYSVRSSGGHASAPAPHTPVGVLSAACQRIESHPFKAHFTKPVLEMFNTLGRHSTFLYRMIFANLWCFGGLLDGICKKSGGELNALVRTTVAFTQMSGSKAPNVIPPSASMVSNIRLNPEDSVLSAVKYLKGVIKNDDIKLNIATSMEPSPISRTDCDEWSKVVNAIAGTWEDTYISPYLMVQCSDSRHYRDISDKVYRFSAMDLTSDERKTIHGNNEHIRLETIEKAVEFFIRVMKQC